MATTPTCSPSSSILRTRGTRIWRFVRGPIGTGRRMSDALRSMDSFLPTSSWGRSRPLLSVARAPVVAAAAESIRAGAPLFEAARAIHGLVAAGLEWHLSRLTAARAGHVEHFA